MLTLSSNFLPAGTYNCFVKGLDVIGRRIVQLFHQIKTGGFLLQSFENRRCQKSIPPVTPRAFSATIETENRITFQPIRNKKNVKKIL